MNKHNAELQRTAPSQKIGIEHVDKPMKYPVVCEVYLD